MWLRITCPNGHPLENDNLVKAARSKRCPDCRATVSMWMKVTCPNGHSLKVRTKHGGSKGNCPECKSELEVPEFDMEAFIEYLLSSSMEKREVPSPVTVPTPEASKPVKAAVLTKNDYYARVFKPELDRKPLTCQDCRTVLFPGVAVCNTCGRPVA